MEKDREYFRKLAKQLMFDLSDEEADDIIQEFHTLESQLKLLEKIDTTGVEEMIYPFEQETTFMREDEVGEMLTQKAALANVSNVKQGHVVVCKVVK